MKEARLPESVYRLGRRPDPWAWPDWTYAGSDGTFGHRFDDPRGVYRVLYASTQRVATFVECLACFRVDPDVLAGYAVIVGDPADDAEPPPVNVVPLEWVDQRCVGEGRLVGHFVELGHHETLAELRRALSTRAVHYGVRDLDASAVRLSAPRAFTQEISRHMFDQSARGTRRWDGISYRSRHGNGLDNWAIFEPAAPDDQQVLLFDVNDDDLLAALAMHGLELG